MDSDKARGQALTLLATTSPLWQRAQMPVMDAASFNKTARELHIWQSTEDALKRPAPQPNEGSRPGASGTAQDMNVVVIFQESTYNEFLSLFDGTNNTEPLLAKYKDRMELFPNFYSSFAGSINARFATFTGLYPVADFNAFTSHHVPVKSLFEVLHDNGYSNSLFYSSFFDYTGFRDFLKGREIEEMYDADTMPSPRTNQVSWGLREDETLGAIKDKIKKYAVAKQKFCLTYVPAAPHNPFDGIPDRFRKRTQAAYGDFTPAYVNELTFMDWVVTSIVDQLKDSGLLDKTLIVITGDHGEMLGANGGPIGHGWAFTPELGNVPLIVLNPNRRGYRVNDTLGSQVDVLPTLLDLLGISLPAGQLYQGTSLYSSNANPNRTIYLNAFRQYGILESGLLFCGNRAQRTRIEGPIGFYSYTNDAARTMFQLLDHSPAGITNLSVSISAFDRFQGNFLHNYSEYCRMAQQTGAVK
jgi:phosphoglycerol transferase MdoB-like AlkP superfamily enzyme